MKKSMFWTVTVGMIFAPVALASTSAGRSPASAPGEMRLSDHRDGSALVCDLSQRDRKARLDLGTHASTQQKAATTATKAQ